MKTRIEIRNGADVKVLMADEGMVIKRKKDEFIMGAEVWLGLDYSTDPPQQDSEVNYGEIEAPQLDEDNAYMKDENGEPI